MQFTWDAEKSALLLAERRIDFEDVVHAIQQGDLLAETVHPNTGKYSHQHIYVVNVRNYAYLVPHVKTPEGDFLKTIIPSRKATKQFLQLASRAIDEGNSI